MIGVRVGSGGGVAIEPDFPGGGGFGGVAFCGEFGGDGGLVVSLSALLTPPRGQPGGIPDSACQCRILFSALLCVILSLSALLPRWSWADGMAVWQSLSGFWKRSSAIYSPFFVHP